MKPFLRPLFLLSLLLAPNAGRSQNDEVRFSIIETTDVHGNYFPYDFINHRPGPGSMSRVATYVKRLRSEMGNHRVLYVDNGDILQGQPTAYYYTSLPPWSTTSKPCVPLPATTTSRPGTVSTTAG